MVTNLRQFTKLGPSSVFQLFNIPSDPPAIAVRNSLTNQFHQKKMMFLYMFNNNKKVQNGNVEKGPGKICHFFTFFENIQNCKFLW